MASYELLELWTAAVPPRLWSGTTLLLHGLQVVVILGATWAVLRVWREKTAREEQLARLVETVKVAQEEERRRIAYDVHDGIAQLIVSAKQHVDTCEDLWWNDRTRAVAELGKASDRLDHAIVETRRILSALRPSDVDARGLASAARRSVEETAQQAGWSTIFLDRMGDVRLPPAVEAAAFRILQEALANIWKHAHTAHVEVMLAHDADGLILEVQDRGVGFLPPPEGASGRGLGLSSMRERARLLGGACTIMSEPGEGTRVRVRLPCTANAHGLRA
ncbi:MAG: sensor histidine kinase [Candidatus Rokuibacteriota bacterium]